MPRTPAGSRVLALLDALAGAVLATIALAASTGAVMAAPATAGAASNAGPMVLIGGVLRYDNEPIWRRLVTLAGGPGAHFEILPVATGRADIYGGFAVKALQARGASAALLPIAADPTTFGRDGNEAAHDPELVQRIRQADAVFFTGGAPQRIARALYDADGARTPLLDAILSLHAAGGLIAGANAGERVIATGLPAYDTLASGLPAGALTAGLGLLPAGWLVDQHLFTHGRIAVTLAALQVLPGRRAIGLAVNSALVVVDRQAEVIGKPGALVIGPAPGRDSQAPGSGASGRTAPPAAEAAATAGPLEGIRLSYLATGDRLDLLSGEVTPAAEKRSGFAIDPNAPDHRPWYDDAAFHPDPFRSNAMLKLIFQAFDGPTGYAVGLVSPESGDDMSPGTASTFRLRFYPGPDTHGWLNAAGGTPDYTVLDLRLDVEPAPSD